jgi:hypothetical protein
VISNQTTATPETPQAARQAALNAVLRRLVAAPPPARTRAAAAPSTPAPQAVPSAPTRPAPVPGWLTAPVLQLAIPDSPLAAGTVGPSQAASPPAAMREPMPEAAATEVFDVPPLIEPVAEARPVPAPDLAARIMSEIAAIVAEAPMAIAPVVVDLSAVKAPEEPVAAFTVPEPSEAVPDVVEPEPAPAAEAVMPSAAPRSRPLRPEPPRTEPALRATVRRTAPRPGRPQRRIAPPRPPKRISAAEARPARPRPAKAAATAQPAAPPAVKAPARERPALAPAATSVARTLRTMAVPETRPLAQNRRLYRRVRLTAELEIAGKPCRLVDLSIGGFAAAGTDKFEQGAVVPVTLRMTIDGINIGTQFSARIVYGNGARAAGRFVDLTGAQTAFLRYVVTWRGEAIGAVGTTTLLDAITRWPERAFQPHPSTVKPPEPARPGFWSRMLGRIPLLGRRRNDQ